MTRPSRLWTFQLLGFEMLQAPSTVSIEIHKSAILDRLKIHLIFLV
jgi:hypothetical protein